MGTHIYLDFIACIIETVHIIVMNKILPSLKPSPNIETKYALLKTLIATVVSITRLSKYIDRSSYSLNLLLYNFCLFILHMLSFSDTNTALRTILFLYSQFYLHFIPTLTP
uniref:Uncharacterized protein n=1 Tax=Ditylum brightwellii TaxID=49249 RepID=A0A7S4R1N2_9STRA